MKNLLLCSCLPILLLMSACSPKVSTQLASSEKPEALDYDKEVHVFNSGDKLPPVIRELGMLKVGDISMNCSYETVLSAAKEEVREAGGNALLITAHNLPDFWNNCHRIAGKVLLVYTDSLVMTEQVPSTIPDSADYALLHVYRSSATGTLMNYNLYLGNDTLCRVKNNYAETIKVTKDGRNSLWAKTESKTEVPINIEFGKEYYVHCGMSMGFFVGRPSITIVVDPAIGKKDFEAILSKQKNRK